jgi:hypothetical protein
VQLHLGPYGQAIGHDLFGDLGGVEAAPDGAEEHFQAVPDRPLSATGLGPGVVGLVAQYELQFTSWPETM